MTLPTIYLNHCARAAMQLLRNRLEALPRFVANGKIAQAATNAPTIAVWAE